MSKKTLTSVDMMLVLNYYLKITGQLDWSWWLVLWPFWTWLILAFILGMLGELKITKDGLEAK